MKGVYFKPKIKYLFALITFEGQQLTRGCGYRVVSPRPFITLPFSPPHRSQTSSPLRGEKNKIRKMEKSKDSSNHLYASEKTVWTVWLIAGAHCVCRWSAIERTERTRGHTNCSQVDKSLKHSVYNLNHLLPSSRSSFPCFLLRFSYFTKVLLENKYKY